MNASQVTYKILFNQKNITRDVSDYLLSLTYTDKVAGESDEIELTLHDKNGLWQNDWYPKSGDTITVSIIDNELVLECGTFSIDEKDLQSGKDGDTFSIRGVAAAISKKLRTKKSSAHEKKTLRHLAQTIASEHGLSLVGTIDPITIGRVTQHHENDLQFLLRIANDFGYTFSVKDKLLVFTSIFDLHGKPHAFTLDKTDVTSFSISDRTEKTGKKAKVKYHNPEKNEVIEHEETYDGDLETGDDDIVIHKKAENKQQAELIAKSALHTSNTSAKVCDISCRGHVLLISGNNIELTGFGRFSGKYHILESTHSIDKSSGYPVSFQAKKVSSIATSKHYPKKKTNSTGSPVVVTRSNAGTLLGTIGTQAQ